MENLFDCHVHTQRSACGEDITDEWLFDQARTRDLCFAVTDHAMHMYYGPDEPWGMYHADAIEVFAARRNVGRERLKRYIADLRAGDCPNLLVGLELDVLPDGQFLFPEDMRDEMDILIAAHHLLPGAEVQAAPAQVLAEYRQQTRWLLGYGVAVLAHPFRLLLSKGYEVDDELIAWVVDQARGSGTALEINSHKVFADHDVAMARACREAGVLLALGTDSHHTREFGNFTYHRDILNRAGIGAAEAAAMLYAPAQCHMARE